MPSEKSPYAIHTHSYHIKKLVLLYGLLVWRMVKAGVIQPEPAGVKQKIDNHKLQLYVL